MTFDSATSYAYTSQNRMWNVAGRTELRADSLDRLDYISSSNLLLGLDGDEMVSEHALAGGFPVRRRFVHGSGVDEPLVWYEGAGTSDRRFLHADERGSIIAVTDNAGDVLAINRYDENGLYASGNIGRFQYTGQKLIIEAGLYDYKARIYHPYLARFMQTDPIGYGDGMNGYAYVGGDPVNFADSSGTESICITEPNGRTGPRVVCVEVDADGDGRSDDNDMTESSEDDVRSDFAGFITRYGGSSSNPTNLAPYGKPVWGRRAPVSKLQYALPVNLLERRYLSEGILACREPGTT